MTRYSPLLPLKGFLFLLAVISITLARCRLTGNYPSDSNPAGSTLSLNGAILIPADAYSSIRATENQPEAGIRAATLNGNLPIAGAEVWIEELPTQPHEFTDKDGKYSFKGLPTGNFRVIARFKKADNTVMKVRSEVIEITNQSEKASVPDLSLKPANKVVTGVLRDADGNFLKPGTVLILWGERFEVGENGMFTSPPLPDDVDEAALLLYQPGQSTKTMPSLPVQFFATDRPTTVDLQMSGKNSQFKPLGATVAVKKNDMPVSVDNPVGSGDRLVLSITLTNIERTFPGITFEWDAGRGSFTVVPGNGDTATWLAPSSSGLATITVKISAPNRGYCKVFLPIVVDHPGSGLAVKVTFDAQNQNPVIQRLCGLGDKITPPASPRRTDYAFAGWFKEAECTNQWNFASDAVTADMTLYAKWLAGNVTAFMVTFNSQGGSAVPGLMVGQGEKITEPSAPARAGFAFGGWYKDQALTNLWSFASDTVMVPLTLHAKWTSFQEARYTLTYTASASGSILGNAVQSVGFGANGTPVTAVATVGYSFVKWSDGSTNNPRTDLNLAGNVTVTALFAVMAPRIPGAARYAWSEGAGWINVAPTHGNLTVKLGAGGYLSGLAWSENLGWIKFAASSATAPYGNTNGSDWGVNLDGSGKLSGFAWSENAGWINFGANSADTFLNQQTGAMSGYAWAENIGWIKFAGSSFGVQLQM
jgi:uncharacterized repeat protein (TIGR02543 family)